MNTIPSLAIAVVMAFCLARTSEAKDGGCPDETFPVCGMNLQDYGSPCLAGADGTAVLWAGPCRGGCTPRPDLSGCGSGDCCRPHIPAGGLPTYCGNLVCPGNCGIRG